jgi:hypothetical protein
MKADAKRQQAAIEQRVATDWIAAQMQPLANAGKLKPLDEWLAMVRPRPKGTPKSMLQVLRDAMARGANLKITKVEG